MLGSVYFLKIVYYLRNFCSFLLIFGLISCQHYPSNVEVIYKSPSGPGYKNTGANLITGVRGNSAQSKPTQEIEELKPLKEEVEAKKETSDLAPPVATQEKKLEIVTVSAQSSALQSAKPLQVVSVPEVKNHKVLAGETYYSIARSYGVSPKEIMQENNYKQGDVLKVGSVVKIPKSEQNVLSSSGNLVAQVPAAQVPVTQTQTSKVSVASSVSNGSQKVAAPASMNATGNIVKPEATKVISPPVMPSTGTSSCGERFIHPVLAKDVLLKFGEKTSGGVKNDGVIYKISSSWPVKAANNGEVAYVGDGFSDYGNIVILKHNKGYFSIYGHLMPNSLKKGQIIMRGDVISKTVASGGKFYFSIRKGKVPIDPSKCF